ncbi:hypothetical protein [Methyloversatilis sp.]|uniref:hypothetical protein n=1 Tax=Methyloversatilis sp. TaxID=2569862 RepID=UPI0035233DFF
MFSTPWPASAAHPDLVRDAAHAFDILRQVLRRVHGDTPQQQALVDLDALYIRSAMHGLAGVMTGNCIGQLDLAPACWSRPCGTSCHGSAAGWPHPDASKLSAEVGADQRNLYCSPRSSGYAPRRAGHSPHGVC